MVRDVAERKRRKRREGSQMRLMDVVKKEVDDGVLLLFCLLSCQKYRNISYRCCCIVMRFVSLDSCISSAGLG